MAELDIVFKSDVKGVAVSCTNPGDYTDVGGLHDLSSDVDVDLGGGRDINVINTRCWVVVKLIGVELRLKVTAPELTYLLSGAGLSAAVVKLPSEFRSNHNFTPLAGVSASAASGLDVDSGLL